MRITTRLRYDMGAAAMPNVYTLGTVPSPDDKGSRPWVPVRAWVSGFLAFTDNTPTLLGVVPLFGMIVLGGSTTDSSTKGVIIPIGPEYRFEPGSALPGSLTAYYKSPIAASAGQATKVSGSLQIAIEWSDQDEADQAPLPDIG